jgi:hypothetical protein
MAAYVPGSIGSTPKSRLSIIRVRAVATNSLTRRTLPSTHPQLPPTCARGSRTRSSEAPRTAKASSGLPALDSLQALSTSTSANSSVPSARTNAVGGSPSDMTWRRS